MEMCMIIYLLGSIKIWFIIHVRESFLSKLVIYRRNESSGWVSTMYRGSQKFYFRTNASWVSS